MKVALIRIGNSRGIRIPKPVIEQCGFGETVELRVEDHRIVISPDQAPRQGWEEAFRAAGNTAHDELIMDLENQFDVEEWRW